MKQHLILNEIVKVKGIVNSFIANSNELIIIESEYIKHGGILNKFSYSELKSIRLYGYCIGATLCYEPMSAKQYIVMLYQNGMLEIRNLEYDIIDSVFSGIKLFVYDHKVQFLFDDIFKVIYVNLLPTCVYRIDLRVSGSQLKFIHTENNPKCIQTLTSKVISMDFVTSYDVYTNEEMQTIAILSEKTHPNRYFFHAIFLKNPGSKRPKEKWQVLIPQIEIVSSNSEAGYVLQRDSLAMKSVSNIGFFVFSPMNTYFFGIPNGFQNVINGESVVDSTYVTKGIHSIYEIRNPNFKFGIIGNIYLVDDPKSLNFSLITEDLQLIEINLEKILEDDDKYLIYWNEFKIKKRSCFKSEYESTITTKGQNWFSLLNNTKYLLQLDSGKLVLGNWLDFDLNSSCQYIEETYIASYIIGSLSKRFIRSGFTNNNTYFIDQEYVNKDEFCSFDFLYILDFKLSNIWSTLDKGLFWYDESREVLIHNGEVSNVGDMVIHMTMNGDIINDISIIKVVDILNDTSKTYCYLTHNGLLKWFSPEYEKTYNLNISNDIRLDSIILVSLKALNGMNITIYYIDNEMIILYNYGERIAKFKCDHELDSIASIYYFENTPTSYIFISDVHGKVCVVDADNLQIYDIMAVDFHMVNIIGIPEKDIVILYSKENLVLLKCCNSGLFHYESVQIDIPFNISKIVKSAKENNVFIVTTNNRIVKCDFDFDKLNNQRKVTRTNTDVLINKLIFLPSSSRYAIGSYVTIAGRDGKLRNSFGSNGLCVYDIYLKKIIQKIETSVLYPKTTISDIAPLSYNNFNFSETYLPTQKISFAKQLIFGQCLIVSLSYELAEAENGDNLLLFLLDDDKGSLEFKCGINTGSNISSVKNYFENYFLAAGGYIQLFKLNYSVKENIFTIGYESNKLPMTGYITLMFIVDDAPRMDNILERPSKKIKLQEVNIQKIISLDILRGFSECQLSITSTPSAGNNKNSSRAIKLSHILCSGENPVILDVSNEKFINTVAINETGSMKYFLMCSGGRKIKIYFTNKDEEEYDLQEFYLPKQVTNASSVRITSSKKCENGKLIDLFTLTTKCNGHYVLSAVEGDTDGFLRATTKSIGLRKQLNYIGNIEWDSDGENEDSDEEEDSTGFIDNRILNHDKLKYT